MENAIGVLITIISGLSVMLITSIAWNFGWKRKHDEVIKAWCTESESKDEMIIEKQEEIDSKDEQILKLEEEIKVMESWGHTVKIETVRIEPKEFECKFILHDRFLGDKDLCKRVMISELARYLAEEFEKDPYLYTVFTERSYTVLQDFIKIKFRMLPYAEPASFNDIFGEEK